MWLEDAGRKVHIDFIDPAEVVGRDEEATAVFHQVRDDIANRVLRFLQDSE